MWRTIVVLALLTTADPVRVGITAFLVARPRPLLNLFAYWLGGMAAGIAAGVTLLLTLRDALPGVIRDMTSFIASCTGGPVQVAAGVVALLIAARIARRLSARAPSAVSVPADTAIAVLPKPPNAFARLSAGVTQSLGSGHPGVAFVAGLGSATPPVESLVVLGAILASGAAAGTQVCGVVLFTVVVLAVVEIPLIGFLATPARTQAFIERLQDWLRARGQIICALTFAGGGLMLVASGMGNL